MDDTIRIVRRLGTLCRATPSSSSEIRASRWFVPQRSDRSEIHFSGNTQSQWIALNRT